MLVHLFSRAVFRSSLHLIIYWRGRYAICLKAFYDDQTLLCWSAVHFVPCVLYRPLGCERGESLHYLCNDISKMQSDAFCMYFHYSGMGGGWAIEGVSVTQFASGYHSNKKKHIPSKCISIFIPLLPQSQREGFYWDEVSTSLEVILPSGTCLLMDGSIASLRLLKFDCDFKDFPFSLPLKPVGIIQPFTKRWSATCLQTACSEEERKRGLRGQELWSVTE